jgi:hypothetical protein
MENQTNDDVKSLDHRSLSFNLAHILIFIFFLLILNTDLAQYSQHTITGIPTGFVATIFVVDLCIVLMLVLQFFYKKIGTFLFPVFVLIHQGLYEFYLSTTLYAGLFLLFVYCTAGLLVVIPRWKSYK